MKRKIVFLTGLIIVVVGFFVGVEVIKSGQQKQVNTEDKKDISGIESYKTEQVVAFSEILELAEVTKCSNVKLIESEDRMLEEKYDFSADMYGYDNPELCKRIIEVFNSYEYIYSSTDVADISDKSIGSVQAGGGKENILCLTFMDIGDENMIAVNAYVESEEKTCIETGLEDKYFNGFLTERAIADELFELLSEYTKVATMEEVKQIIDANEGVMKQYKLLCFEHERSEDYSNYETDDWYRITKMPLSDYEGYLKVYYLNATVGDDKYMYIFKVELYDNTNQLTEIIYSDTESYEAYKNSY